MENLHRNIMVKTRGGGGLTIVEVKIMFPIEVEELKREKSWRE
jgi:hypothetical protein